MTLFSSKQDRSTRALALVACAFGLIVSGSASAADLPSHPFEPEVVPVIPAFRPFFVRVGASVGFSNATIDTNIGGFAPFIPATYAGNSGYVNPLPLSYAEAGYYFTPNVAVSLSAGFPPSLTTVGQNGLAGSGVLYRSVAGLPTLVASYHLTNFGAIRPYLGLGFGYAFVFRNESAAVQSPYLRNAAAFVVNGGLDYDLTQHWSVFADAKASFLTQRFTGVAVVPTPFGALSLPVASSVRSKPVIISAGLGYRF